MGEQGSIGHSVIFSPRPASEIKTRTSRTGLGPGGKKDGYKSSIELVLSTTNASISYIQKR